MVHLVHDTNGERQSYQLSWMSRWMRTSCDMTGKSRDSSSNAFVNDLNYITKDVPVTSRSVKGLGMIETLTSELVNDSKRPSAESLRNERSCGYLFQDGQESDDKGASAHEIGQKFDLKNGIRFQPVLHGVPAANGTSLFRGCPFLDAVSSKNNQLDHANLRKPQRKGRDTLSQPADLDSGKKRDCQSRSNISLNDSFRESSYRWVKRLRLSSSARGTKSINLAENSSRKRNNFFSRILKSDITKSESTLRVHHGEESMALDKSINLSKENLGNDLSLSHVWIQRWLRNGSKSTRKKPYTMVDCESQSLNWEPEDLRKDRPPSIRAMAMMGKTIKSFQPCQLEKRGSLTIWNTKVV